MSKRSKVLLIILIVVVLTILLSFFNEEPATDDKLEQWEEEIINPNNQLDPLNEKVGDSIFILNVASKVENFINKFFSLIISFCEGVIDRIFLIV